MTWVAIAVGGAALVGGAVSYSNGQKQAAATKKAAQVTADAQSTNNANQQPFIQSGYGALSRLNTLLGINPAPTTSSSGGAAASANPAAAQTVTPSSAMTIGGIGRGITPIANNKKTIQPIVGSSNPQLRQLLAIRAQNGDAQAKQLLGITDSDSTQSADLQAWS